MLNLRRVRVTRSQVRLEDSPKQLRQHLEAYFGDGRVVAALAELVPDEGVLCPCELVEAEHDTGLAQLLPDQVASSVGDVRVLDAEDHGNFSLDLRESVDRMVAVRGRLW